MSELTCPKCQGAMRQYERNGVHVDQCTECRGIYLDRGELEHLTEAESRWSGPQPPASAPASVQPAHQPQYQSQSRQEQQYQQSYSKPKKKRSFLEELFE